jgi:hypothetical protein
MEAAMLRTRIVAIGASFVMFLAVTLAGATAQTAEDSPGGKPLPLLQIVGQNHQERLRSHAKLAAKRARTTHAKRRLARHVARHVPVRTRRAAARASEKPAAAAAGVAAAVSAAPAAAAPAPPADNIWLAPNAAIPGGAGTPVGAGTPDGAGPSAGQATIAPQQPPVSFTTEPVVTTAPDQIAGDSHTVQAGSPSGSGPPDPAVADSQKAAAPAAGSPTEPLASADKQAAAVPVAPAHAAHAMMVKPATPSLTAPPSQVGSASWIAHILAALGGAIAAGVVAWFLIRPAAARRYS